VFRNLFYEDGFLDYNYNDFFDDGDGFGRLESVTNAWIESCLRRSYRPGRLEGGLEPYFDRTLPTTLSPKSCQGFLRQTKLPIDERDYYLSKLFQFIYVTLDVRFELGFSANEVSKHLREILDEIPIGVLPPDSRIDWSELWWDFYRMTHSQTQDVVMSWLEKRISVLVHGSSNKTVHERRHGPEPDLHVVRKTAGVIQSHYLGDWKRADTLQSVCEDLDKEEVPMSSAWRQWATSPGTWVQALQLHKERVVKLIDYRLKQARRYATDRR
jgi:hypothetical protein